MLNHEVPYALSPSCFIHYLYIDAWHHSLSTMIRNASRQFAVCISRHYRTETVSCEYQIFSAFGAGYWMIGVGAEIPDNLRLQYPSLIISERIIEQRHCTGNIALIVEHELGKMPVGRISRHYIDKLTVTCND
ncbi:hypothetical protein PZE02_003478 [Salmonella enterica subsp. enterica serovar Vitkin]|uniref:Uncharacterized protein n=3 Tax=Salmonella enterica TaxID=28901 RepID=A0A5Z6P3S4_SALET|nr:hypothetical protein [Salmonella enterica]EBG5369117.1 hypothetical protein [Salmonella enterica subsp. enterica serovar Monschaui]EBH8279000.1 hypothetical protein [Salmonella enterica subsp. enterica serovar Typhimurium str. UK-1]EBP3975291.1 hypothetical protein [Salmonella enterica subsp. enterica]EBS2690458.1 hypothetical protein [Salmonella enterica subsp. enterica serovar Muenchen]EBY0126242.1 hypothetical protein [Salmonella enterica subsp. enterica serovar Vitkin]EBY1916035.1 hypo